MCIVYSVTQSSRASGNIRVARIVCEGRRANRRVRMCNTYRFRLLIYKWCSGLYRIFIKENEWYIYRKTARYSNGRKVVRGVICVRADYGTGTHTLLCSEYTKPRGSACAQQFSIVCISSGGGGGGKLYLVELYTLDEGAECCAHSWLLIYSAGCNKSRNELDLPLSITAHSRAVTYSITILFVWGAISILACWWTLYTLYTHGNI